MTVEELLEKLERLSRIPAQAYRVRGKPGFIGTPSVDGELLVTRWGKRCRQYKINLINQFKKEGREEILFLVKTMTEHLDQNERNEWFDIQLIK